MEKNIFALAKELTSLKPSKPGTVLAVFRKHGYDVAWRPNSVILAMSEALVSCWDGKASTLDQAAAWREVWKYLGDAGLVKECGGRLPVQQVLDILGNYRRMSAGAEPLVDTAKRTAEEGWPTPRPWDTARMDLVSVRTSMSYFTTESQQDELVHGAVTILANAVEKVIRYLDHVPKITVPDDLLDTSGILEGVNGCPPILSFIRANKRHLREITRQAPAKVEVIGEASVAIDGVHLTTEDSKWEGLEFGKGCTVYLKSGGPAMTVADVDDTTALVFRCEWKTEPDCVNTAWFRPTSLTRQAPEREPGRFHPGDYVRHAENGECGVVVECTTKGLLECRVRWDAYQDELEWVENRKLNLAPAKDNSPEEDISFQVDPESIELFKALDGIPSALKDTTALACWNDALEKLATVVEPARLDVMRRLLVVQDTCYGLANNAGWWQDLETGVDVREWPEVHLDNWISAKLMLIVTEIAEAMEGHRKGLKDTHLKHRGMLEVELADAVIRIMDLAGGLNMDVAGAIVEKLAYNMTREDHQIENRKAEGGKSV